MGGPKGFSIDTKNMKNDSIPRLRKDIERIYGVGMAEVALNYICDPRELPGDDMLYVFLGKAPKDDDADSDLPDL